MPACRMMATVVPGDQPTEIDIAVRCAMVNMRVSGVPIVAHLGGVAVASFPGVEDIPIQALLAGTSFPVEWHDAFFYGEHRTIGPMQVRLRPKDMLPGVSTNGVVQSLAARTGPDAVPGDAFFPAVNTNEFYWRITLPRYGVVMDSDGALVIEATISTVPPMEEVYRLRNRVHFRVNATRSGLLRRVVPDITVEQCSVKLQELRDLNASIVLDGQGKDSATFQLMFDNRSSEDKVLVSWVIWPRPEEAQNRAQGTIRLGRGPRSVPITLPRDIFYRERYLAASIAEPFETKGASVALFPSLP